MRIIKIPKTTGSFRTIYVPNRQEKKRSRDWLPKIAALATAADPQGVQHGFTAGRSPITNAQVHTGYQFSLCFDLKNFFDSVKPHHCQNLPPAAVPDCFYDGAARQGLPSSPALANLAAVGMDQQILSLNQNTRLGDLFVYTRYADDLAFSFNMPAVKDMLLDAIPRITTEHGFTINPAKTHFQTAAAGRRMIKGIAVDTTIHIPRASKRRLRAIQHQRDHGATKRTRSQIRREYPGRLPFSVRRILEMRCGGLHEWLKLKMPKNYAAPAAPNAKTTTSASHPAFPMQNVPSIPGDDLCMNHPFARKLILDEDV